MTPSIQDRPQPDPKTQWNVAYWILALLALFWIQSARQAARIFDAGALQPVYVAYESQRQGFLDAPGHAQGGCPPAPIPSSALTRRCAPS